MGETRDPCDDCSEIITSGADHGRCARRDCGCSCRDHGLDVGRADARLRAAMACQSAIQAEMPDFGADEEATAYVVGIIKDRLSEELEYLMGMASRPGAEPPPPSSPPPRQFSEEEEEALRALAKVSPGLLALLLPEARQRRAQPRLPPEEEGYDPDELPPAQSPAQPPVPSQKPKRNVGDLRRSKAQPMPSVSAMTHVTGLQAMQATQMGERAFERVRHGQAAGSGGNNESTG